MTTPQIQPIAGTINPETLYNALVNERLMSSIQNISKNPFSPESFISFGIILLSNEIKMAFLDLIGWMKSTIPYIVNFFMFWFKNIQLFRKPTPKPPIEYIQRIETTKTTNMEIEITPEYMECLINFTKVSRQATFTLDKNIKLKMDSLHTAKLTQGLNNVKYTIPCQDEELTVQVKEALNFESVSNDLTEVIEIAESLETLGIQCGKFDGGGKLCMKNINMFNGFGSFIKTNGKQKCVNYLKQLGIYDLITLSNIFSGHLSEKQLEALLLFIMHMCACAASAPITVLFHSSYFDIYHLSFNIDQPTIYTRIPMPDFKMYVGSDLTYMSVGESFKISQTPPSMYTLHLNIISNLHIEDAKIVDVVKTFFESNVSSSIVSQKCGAAINISELSIENKEEIEEKENPAYKDWLRLSTTPTDTSSTALSPISMMQIRPQETIKTTTIKKQVVSKIIGECKKPIKTLYLPNGLQSILIKQLEKFRDETELYEQLGIPHKFGLLLHGPPGTGKSTTIKAIASFLGRHMYYINLRGIHTNKELKMLFDHVHTMTTGGLIVFEDIDVMTPIVLRRNTQQIENVCELMSTEEDSLTLSYLLNLLDGPLCKENTVFAMTTNDLDSLDPALYREGRIDFLVKLNNCDETQFYSIVQSLLQIDIPAAIVSRLELLKHSPASVIQRIFRYIGMNTPIETILQPFISTPLLEAHS